MQCKEDQSQEERLRWKYYKNPKTANSTMRVTVDFGARRHRLRSRGFLCQTKKVNSRGHILFSLLASLFAHQSGQSLYIALEGYNLKNFHPLTQFRERKFLLLEITLPA